jgi:hypothetical protein
VSDLSERIFGTPRPSAAPKPKRTATAAPLSDPRFRTWFQRYDPHGSQWDPVNAQGLSGGYRLYRAYQLGLRPDAAGHLPDVYRGERLKTDSDDRAVIRGIDGRTGIQVAPPSYTGPMTPQIRADAWRYMWSGTAQRRKSDGWDVDAPAVEPPRTGPDFERFSAGRGAALAASEFGPHPSPGQTRAAALAEGANPRLGMDRSLVPYTLGPRGARTAAEAKAREVQSQRTGASDTAAILGPMATASAALNVPQSLLGAGLLDVERYHRAHPGVPWYADVPIGPTQENANRLLAQRRYGELMERYGMYGSPQANAARAKTGDAGAQFLHHHPTAEAVMSFAAPFADPTNILTGRVLGAIGPTLRGATSLGAEGLAGLAERRGLTGLATRLRDAGDVARTTGTLDRFARVRNAAATEANAGRGALAGKPLLAGAAGRAVAVNIANARKYGETEAENAIAGILGKWKPTREQLHELWRRYELGRPSIGKGGAQNLFDAKTEAHINATLGRLRAYMTELDKHQVAAGAIPEQRLWQQLGGVHRYLPRKGAWADEERNALDDAVQQYIDEHRSSQSGPSFRYGTAGKNIHRTWNTIAQAEANGARLDPLWNPLDTLQSHIAQRTTNMRLGHGLQQLADLGLIEPPRTDEFGRTVMPSRSDFVPHNDVSGTQTFGAPILREGTRYHPAVNQLIADVTSRKPTPGFPSGLQMLAAPLRAANRGLSYAMVANPIYHPLVNQLPMVLASGALRHPGTFAKAFLAPVRTGALQSAIEAGAEVPASLERKGADFLSWRGLTPDEKLARVVSLPGRATRALTSTPLYRGYGKIAGIQPRITAATYAALKRDMSPAQAQEVARQIASEPENIKAAEQDLAQLAQFPHFLKATARFWLPRLLRNPAMYQGTHGFANVMDQRYGVSPDAADYNTFLPPFAIGRNRAGANMLSLPSPANRPVQALSTLLNIARYGPMSSQGGGEALKLAANVANPTLGMGGRIVYTGVAPAGPPDTYRLWDKDDPNANPWRDALTGGLMRFRPLRSPTLGALLGLSTYTRSNSGTYRTISQAEQKLRGGFNWHGRHWPGLEQSERDLAYFQRIGDKANAERARRYIGLLWRYMQYYEGEPMKNVTPRKAATTP